MISFEKAFDIVMQHSLPMQQERVHFTEATGRVTAEDIFSDINMPPFRKSAVDGFACRPEDIRSKLLIIETIPAGKVPEKPIEPGQASRIMTGAMLPEGAGCVVMVEDSEVSDDGKVKFTKEFKSTNICNPGEDIHTGDLIIRKGTRIAPQHIACLAAIGAINPLVYKKIRVGILSSGDELVEPDIFPTGSFIRNSNSWQLMAQVTEAGALPEYGGIAADAEESLHSKISLMLETNDVVLLTGGVSAGDFDFVPSVLEKLGFSILVKSVAIQPGKPVVFAVRRNKFIFGLPGNPVSSFVLFEMLVKPFLKKNMGDTGETIRFRLPAGMDISRKKSERKGIIPVTIKNDEVYPVEYHGSAHINAYSEAKGMIIMEPGIKEIKKGELIYVRQI